MLGIQCFIGYTSNLTPLLPKISNSEFENYFPFGKNNSDFITETMEKQISLQKNVWLKSNTVQNSSHYLIYSSQL